MDFLGRPSWADFVGGDGRGEDGALRFSLGIAIFRGFQGRLVGDFTMLRPIRDKTERGNDPNLHCWQEGSS